jgi:hypothetical protein
VLPGHVHDHVVRQGFDEPVAITSLHAGEELLHQFLVFLRAQVSFLSQPSRLASPSVAHPCAACMLTLALADELRDGNTAFLIEPALDEARSKQFRLAGRLD